MVQKLLPSALNGTHTPGEFATTSFMTVTACTPNLSQTTGWAAFLRVHNALQSCRAVSIVSKYVLGESHGGSRQCRLRCVAVQEIRKQKEDTSRLVKLAVIKERAVGQAELNSTFRCAHSKCELVAEPMSVPLHWFQPTIGHCLACLVA